MKQALSILSLLVLLTGTALAESRYVSDRLEITMRSGKSTGHGILRMLRSGTQVQVLETDKASGYSRIKTRSGKEGWVLTRFLMNGPAARDRLAESEKRLAELELENRKLNTAMAALREEVSSVEQQRQSLDSEHRDVSQELAEIKRTASSALAIDNENKELKSRMVALERSLQTVQQENENLKDRTARDWF